MTDPWGSCYGAGGPAWGATPDVPLLRYAGMLPPGRALDLGAGDGRNALYLSACGFRVTAVDGAAGACAALEARAAEADLPVETLRADLAGFAIEPGAFSLVVASHVLNFFERAAADRLLAAIRDALAPGGAACLAAFSVADPGFAWSRDHLEALDERTFRSARDGRVRHYFTRDSLLEPFAGLETLYLAEGESYDRGHGGAGPHRHGFIEYMGRRPVPPAG